ncbi:terminase [Streptomyces sp. NPDC037389]|uniref:terminase n=1 Tax=Streptomyces sp. NPDC037389 TaxID=3155369 RepID=UPI0033C17527
MSTPPAAPLAEEEPPETVTPVALGPAWQRNEDGSFVVPERSLGWHVSVWAAEYLQHPDGQPWTFTGEQFRFVLWFYALDADGRFLYRDAVLQRLKGWGKDPTAAAISAIELVGPCRPTGRTFASGELAGQPIGQPHPAAWVQCAAVSFDQNRNLMTLFPSLFTKKAIEEYGIELGKTIIYARKGAARIEAVTSSPAALEGGRTTATIMNETHWWTQSTGGHEMAAVIERNATKSADGAARTLAITNAFEPGLDSVAERTREAWEDVQAGRAADTGLLYDSLEAPPEAKLTAEWAPAVIRAVRGDAVWLDVDRIVASILDVRNPPSRSRRFWYNQITASEDAWMAPYEWDACARPDVTLSDGDEIVVFFDGSTADDATALAACRVSDGHVVALGVWQRPPKAPDGWTVPRGDVDGTVRQVFNRYRVLAFFADPGTGTDPDAGGAADPGQGGGGGGRYWSRYIDQWAQDFGRGLMVHATTAGHRRHAVEWDMGDPRRQQLFTEAVIRTRVDILERVLTHDGHRIMRTHVTNSRRRVNPWGITIGKEHRESQRKIDAAVCMVGARMLRRLVLNSHKFASRRKARGSGRVVVLG